MDENSVSFENVPFGSIVDGFCSHDRNGVRFLISNDALNATTNKLLKANMSSVNDTTSKVTFLAIPRCHENGRVSRLVIRCVNKSNALISKSATINIIGC